MELKSDDYLHSNLTERTSLVRAAMYRATRRIQGFNWYTAGVGTQVVPSQEAMIEYGTIAAIAYHDEGIEFGQALAQGIKLMSSWTYNEGKGTLTRAKGMLEDGYAWGVGSVAFETIPDHAMTDPDMDLVELLDLDLEEIRHG
jgi:hypothetical protein